MKNFKALSVLALLLIFSALSVRFASAQEATLEVVNAADGTHEFTFPPETPIGTTFVANITLTNCNNVGAYQLNMTWNPALLNVTDVASIVIPSDDIFSPNTDLIIREVHEGNLYVAVGIGLSGPPSVNVVSGRLCQITFTIISNTTVGSTNIRFALAPDVGPLDQYTFLTDPDANEIPFTPIVGEYTLIPEFNAAMMFAVLAGAAVAVAFGTKAFRSKTLKVKKL